jgi:purine-binding chemotaxis protein CheW
MTGAQARLGAADLGLVTFRLAGQWFGVPVSSVQEVLLPQPVARIPLAPRELAGFLNLRGQIVTVIDLASRLGYTQRQLGQPSEPPSVGAAPMDALLGMDVVVRDGGELFALHVDEVGEVVTVLANAVEPMPATLDRRWCDVCTGVVRRTQDVIMVLDTNRVVSDAGI